MEEKLVMFANDTTMTIAGKNMVVIFKTAVNEFS